ncbi:hypothetical protein AAG589_06305 [Isoptericola sp. F-RaC21]|uniref:hypothetical protein n=1 Tax=Isoptericola sp. F-RaC21 TaxID=3141452 RepID=UPI00315C0AD6
MTRRLTRRPVRRPTWRGALAPVLAGVALAALVGCGGGGQDPSSPSPSSPTADPAPTADADQAWAAYGALPQDLASALDHAVGDLGWTELQEPAVAAGDGTCALNLSRQRSEQVLLDLDDADLSASRAALDPVLAGYGFPPLSEPTTDGGGQTVVASEHPDGGEVTLTTRSDTVLDVGGVPLDPAGCTPGAYVPADR